MIKSKSLYGLKKKKNSSQAWFRTIKNFLVEEAGFVQKVMEEVHALSWHDFCVPP